MARPKSADKRNAIIDAATRVIVAQGLSAPTAVIAKEAGISNGSLFTYFETKADLFNELYVELKTSMAAVAFKGLPANADLRKQLWQLWSNWMRWAAAAPEKRRALMQLGVSEDITPASRAIVEKHMAGIADLLKRARDGGPLHKAPMKFVISLMNALADATVDFMIHDKAHADQHCKTGFEAFWRVIS